MRRKGKKEKGRRMFITRVELDVEGAEGARGGERQQHREFGIELKNRRADTGDNQVIRKRTLFSNTG